MTGVGAGSSGQRLGRYHLAEPLGGGPTGEVFRAKVYGVAGFERQYAIKRFHRDLVSDPAAAAAIAAAARSYGGLEHPRIARLHEYGVAGGATFTATELVDGLDLARLASLSESGEPLVIGGAAWLWSQIARSVGFAHGQGFGHLGLCPTNLIATKDGDIVITDFGFLPPRLPARPGDDDTLAARIPYLAPEQLVGESTSSATDVFQLGVIGYELLTGIRPFHGASGFETAQKILSGRVDDPPLPKPLTKVVMRCLARSPFERFPDARALADAIDAAVRQTPLPGGRRDVAIAVSAARERADEMVRTQSSGALSFALPAPPTASNPALRLPARKVGEDSMGVTVPWRDDGGALGDQSRPTDLDEDLPTSIRTAAELRGEPARLGMGVAKASEVPPPRPGTQHDPDVLMVLEDLSSPSPSPSPSPKLKATEPMPAHLASALLGAAAAGQEGLESRHQEPAQRTELPLLPRAVTDAGDPLRDVLPPLVAPDSGPLSAQDLAGAKPLAEDDLLQSGPPPIGGRRGAVPETLMDIPAGDVYHAPFAGGDLLPDGQPLALAKESSNRSFKAVLALVAVSAVGVGGFLAYQQFFRDGGSGGAAMTAKPTASGAIDGGAAIARPANGQSDSGAAVAMAVHDGGAEFGEGSDAGTAAGSDDGVAGDEGAEALEVSSTPAGARVYVDGTDHGKTPQTIEAAADQHTVAVILPGHKLYRVDKRGLGQVTATLEEVSPPDGPAGIKVRCKVKNRYYVILDGNDTGQLCPTERLGVELGAHVVEIYDPITDSRKEFRVDVKQTRNSVRVKID